MDDEVRLLGHSVDFVDCRLQSSGDVRISWLVETDVAVTDLNKSKVRAFAGIFAVAFGEGPRYWNAAAHGPYQACSSPCHALQEPTTIDSIVIQVLQTLIDKILLFV